MAVAELDNEGLEELEDDMTFYEGMPKSKLARDK